MPKVKIGRKRADKMWYAHKLQTITERPQRVPIFVRQAMERHQPSFEKKIREINLCIAETIMFQPRMPLVGISRPYLPLLLVQPAPSRDLFSARQARADWDAFIGWLL